MPRALYPFPITGSGLINAPASTVRPVHVHSAILNETVGSTDATLKFYIPTESANHDPAAASTGGTELFTLDVPKGGQLIIPDLGGDGMYFKNGLYVAVSGGTLLGVLNIS